MIRKRKQPRRTPVEPLSPDPRQGLTREQVQHRERCGWGNRADLRAGRTEWQIILDNSLTFFNLVFVVMAALMLVVGSSLLNLTFMGVVCFNTAIGCFQEIRAKRALDKLMLVAARNVTVIRDGEAAAIPSEELVRDDIVEFSPGEQICADGVLRTGQLHVNESLLTGEEDAILKNPGDSLLSGSFVVAGIGRVQLTRVGNDAYGAKLSAEAKKDPRAGKTEMMRALDKLIRFVGFSLIPVGLLLFFSQLRHSALRHSVEATVAALVGMIPEGLYLLTSVALAVSALKLIRRKVLVQDMSCIEALARVDVLCVDKTGTITQPGMELEQIVPIDGATPQDIEEAISALFDTVPPENETGKALKNMFPGSCHWKLEHHIPFESQRKWSGSQFAEHGAFLAGAPERIAPSGYEKLRAQVEDWAQKGYRVLLLAAYDGALQKELEEDLVRPMALVVLANRLRPNARETFRYFEKQGVTVKVISGDDPMTVSGIAVRAGIPGADQYIDTAVLETHEDFLRAARDYTVFGRVTPEKKKQLILALKELGHTVAMTGDGVNDLLAMKAADCSIAMASGSQAASQVARMVLLESDFAAMPDIVGEGRRVINNIQRAATLFLVKNIFSMGLALITLFTSLQFPIESFHLTIVSSLTIGIPGFFLALEPNYQRVSGKFLPKALRKAFPSGITNILVVLTAQAFMRSFGLPAEDIQSVTTAVLCVVGLSVLFSVCHPFTKLRKILWVVMAVCVAGAFVVLPPITGYLRITAESSWLVMLAVLLMTPTVYIAIHRLFNRGERLIRK